MNQLRAVECRHDAQQLHDMLLVSWIICCKTTQYSAFTHWRIGKDSHSPYFNRISKYEINWNTGFHWIFRQI